MPTPETSASSSSSSSSPPVALINGNITELAIEEADSFKANLSTMTQDQCLDNGHQANSIKCSSSDNVGDDLIDSKNSVVSNGVNSVQEFNVDVNREHSSDLVIVINRNVDADSLPTGKVLPTSKQLTEIPSDFVDSKDILNIPINNIDANKSECANNIVADMTVITHQNSSENIRDIIANSEKANKNSSDSQLDRFERSSRSDINQINLRNSNKPAGTRRNRKLIRSENVNECQDNQIEDPIERLNKLRASISSALSEVKGVLKQYSTEQSCEDQNESAPSTKEPLDDGPVRFRFVRKIRRRSVYSEGDETEIPKTSTDVTTSPIIENKVIEEVQNEFKDIQKILLNENQNLTDQNKDGNAISSNFEDIEKPIKNDNYETDTKLNQITTAESFGDIHVPQDKSDNGYTTVSEIQKTTKEDSLSVKDEVTSSTSETPKIKNGKTKKILKKDRRASIAAVEINQISNDQSPIPLELKTQRRPSDSGTLIKQTTRIKTKVGEKTKLTSNRKPKTGSSKFESSTITPSQTLKAVEKADAALSSTEVQSSSATVDSTKSSDTKTSGTVVIEKQTESRVSVASTSATPLQLIQEKTPAAIVESKTHIPEKADLSSISPLISQANASAGTNVAKLDTPEVTPTPAVNVDTIRISPKVTEVNTTPSAGTRVVEFNTPEFVSSAPTVNSSVNTYVPETSPNTTEFNISTGTKDSIILKSNAPEVPPTPAVSTELKDNLPHSVPEMPVTSVKPDITEVSTQSKQNLKTSTEATKVEIPNQQISKSKQLSQSLKTGKPLRKSNTPVLPTKTPDAQSASVKAELPKSIINPTEVLEIKTVSSPAIQLNKQTRTSTEVEKPKVSKAASVEASKTMQATEKILENKKSIKSADSSDTKQVPELSTTGLSKINAESSIKIDTKTSDAPETLADESSNVELDVPKPTNVPKDAVAVKFNLPGQESVEELQRLEEQQTQETSPPQTPETTAAATPKKKRKAKRKVVIRRIKRKLSKDDTFLHPQETASELEICEKEIEEKDLDEEPEEEVSDVPKQPKSCLKNRQFEIGDVVMYAEHYKKTQVRWKKAIVTERITSISYKLNIEGDERPAHISYIKKFTDRKVNFGGKEYLEIDYAQIEENEEKERNYSIWNLV